MGRTCAVKGCGKSSGDAVKLSMFQFPKTEQLRKAWESFAGQSALPKNPVICSRHFSPEWIDMGFGRRDLKSGAIPTLYGIDKSSVSIRVHEINLVVSKNRPTYIVRLPGGDSVKINVTFEDSGNSRPVEIGNLSMHPQQNIKKQPHHEDIEATVQPAKQSKLAPLSSKQPKSGRLCKIETVSMPKYKRDVRLAEKRGRDKIRTQLSKIFTPLQIERIVTGKKLNWTAREITLGVSLKNNRNCYDELVKLKYPLPPITTLRRWISDIRIQPGILHPIINILTTEFKDCTLFPRQCVLSFDEMSLDSRCQLDPSSDKVYGMVKNVQVYMVRGLLESWKQVFAYGFDESLSSRQLLDMIGTLETAGLHVRAVVCDLGGKNRALFKELGITVEASCSGVTICNNIQSPVYGHKIYFFADMPHLIKLMRNNILNHGIVYQADGGEEVTLGLTDFEALIASEKDSELKCAWKLTTAHLYMTNREKMKVKTATQLLSRTVAAMFDRDPKYKHVANLIRLINDHYDVLNSMHVQYAEEQKHPFGMRLSLQKDILLNMMEMIRKIKVLGFSTLLPFQCGYLLTSQSLLDLFDDLNQSSMKVEYILTRRLNQDGLENLFGFIRLMSSNSTPHALEFSRRLKLVLVSRLCFTLANANNELDPDEVDFISIKLLESLGSLSPTANPEIELEDDVPDEIDILHESDSESKLESEAFEKLCGYVAYKLKSDVPSLMIENRESVDPTRWTWATQRAYLEFPSDSWKTSAKTLEIEFLKFHSVPKGINRAPGALKGFVTALQKKYPDMSPLAIEMFIKTRLNIRIASINKKIKQQKNKMASLSEERVKFLQRFASSFEDEILSAQADATTMELEGHLKSFGCDDFPWSSEVARNVDVVLGCAKLSSLQKVGINATLSGLDVLAVMPTGSGKSAIFQIAAMASKGFGIVVSPLKAIIQDQVSKLKSLGVAVFAYEDMMNSLKLLLGSEESQIKLIYVTPEGLASSTSLQQTMDASYAKSMLSLVAIDEAHCVVDWGKQFRKDYQFLQHLKLKYPDLPILALTATATEKKAHKIQAALSMRNPIVLRESAFHSNISYDMMWIKASQKVNKVKELVNSDFKSMAGIIYCRTKKECEQLGGVLRQEHILVEIFHGELQGGEKNRILREWLDGKIKVVVATVAFGLGVHNWNCKFVIHFSPCSNVSQFVQESGRSGRDGQQSYSVVLFNVEDFLATSKSVFLQPNGLTDLFEVARLCIDGSVCKQEVIRKLLGYTAVSTNCLCIVCSNQREMVKVNVTPYIKSVLAVVNAAASSKIQITFAQLVNILLGKNRNKTFASIPLPVRKHSREAIQALLCDALCKGYIKLSFDFKKLCTACFVELGSQAISFDKNLTYYALYNVN